MLFSKFLSKLRQLSILEVKNLKNMQNFKNPEIRVAGIRLKTEVDVVTLNGLEKELDGHT